MAFNPFNRRPVERVAQSRTFTDGADTFTLTFVKPGQLVSAAAFDRAEELTARYLGTDEKPGMGFPPIGGVIVKITPTAVMNAAFFEAMQPDNAAERYSADEFIAMQATLSDACWVAVSDFGNEVRQGSADVPPTSGAVTGISSASVSGTQNSTPN